MKSTKSFRNRVKEIRSVKGKDVRPSPSNWRVHPFSQKQALKGILSEVGIAGVPVCYENAQGELVALDGHCRLHDIGANQTWQVAVLDITEEEAKRLIAVYDPISEMAEADPHMLSKLIDDIHFSNPDLNALLSDIAADNGVTLTSLEEDEEEEALPIMGNRKQQKRYPVIIDCSSEEERDEVLRVLCLPQDKKRIDAAFVLNGR